MNKYLFDMKTHQRNMRRYTVQLLVLLGFDRHSSRTTMNGEAPLYFCLDTAEKRRQIY